MKRALILVYITGLIIGIAYGLHGPILPVFAKNIIGASYSELGFIGLANFIPYMFIPLFVGILLDRFNNGYLLALGVIINSSSIYLLSIAQSVPEIMSFRIMTGIAHAFFWPPCLSIISNISKEKKRVRNMSWFTMFFVIGFMAGPLIGSVILEDSNISYRILFQITAFVLAAAIISAILASKRKITNVQERFTFSSIKQMKRFPVVIVVVVFFTASFGIILTIYPAFLNDSGLDDTDIFLVYFAFGISRVASLAIVSKFSTRISQTLIGAIASIPAGLMVSVMADSVAMFAFAMVLMGFGFSIFSPLTIEIILSRTRKEISGKIIGAYETIFGMGWVIGPTIGGTITESFGISSPYFVFGLIGIGVVVLGIIARKRLEPKRIEN